MSRRPPCRDRCRHRARDDDAVAFAKSSPFPTLEKLHHQCLRRLIETLTYVDALREAMAQEMRADPSVFGFGLDVDDHKAIQGSTRGLARSSAGPRVRHPLSEDAMTGVAIAADDGMRPIHVQSAWTSSCWR